MYIVTSGPITSWQVANSSTHWAQVSWLQFLTPKNLGESLHHPVSYVSVLTHSAVSHKLGENPRNKSSHPQTPKWWSRWLRLRCSIARACGQTRGSHRAQSCHGYRACACRKLLSWPLRRKQPGPLLLSQARFCLRFLLSFCNFTSLSRVCKMRWRCPPCTAFGNDEIIDRKCLAPHYSSSGYDIWTL